MTLSRSKPGLHWEIIRGNGIDGIVDEIKVHDSALSGHCAANITSLITYKDD